MRFPLGFLLSGLKLCLLMSGICHTPLLVAQDEESKLPKFMLAASQLGDFKLEPLYYADFKKNEDGKMEQVFLPLTVSIGSRSGQNAIPLIKPVKLYTGRIQEGVKPEMKEFATIPADSPKDKYLLVLFQVPSGGTAHYFLDDSLEKHPAGTVRLANFSTRRVAFTAGGNRIVVAAGSDARTNPVPGKDARFPFIFYAETSDDEPYIAPTKMLQFRTPKDRLLILYATRPVKIDDGGVNPDGTKTFKIEYEPVAFRLYDRP